MQLRKRRREAADSTSSQLTQQPVVAVHAIPIQSAQLHAVQPPDFQAMEFVNLRPNDSDTCVRVRRSVLEQHECKTLAECRHTAPSIDDRGEFYWQTSMSADLVQTLVRSLELSTLCLQGSTSVHEALAMFDHEAIAISEAPIQLLVTASEKHTLKFPSFSYAGVARSDLQTQRNQRIRCMVYQIVYALVHWPRLLEVVENSLTGSYGAMSPYMALGLQPSPGQMHINSNVGSATRVWVAFCMKPCLTYGVSTKQELIAGIGGLCETSPWLKQMVLYVLARRQEFISKGTLNAPYTPKNFDRLRDQLETSPMRSFSFSMYDCCRERHSLSRFERNCIRQASDVKRLLLDVAKQVKPDTAIPDDPNDTSMLGYVYGLFQYIHMHILQTPNPGHIFNNACDFEGVPESQEKKLFGEVCKSVGVRVLAWSDSSKVGLVNCLSFPSVWRNRGPSLASASIPCVLVDLV
jgi:hypothetical protein